MIDELYDTRNFPVMEEYIGYDIKVLSKMTLVELRDELKRADRELNIAKEEVEKADGHPSYVLKERVKNAEYYKKKVEDTIDNLTQEELQNTSVDALIADLHKQLKNNTITKEYHDEQVAKLQEKKEEQENYKKEKSKKKHRFKLFKSRLSDYKR